MLICEPLAATLMEFRNVPPAEPDATENKLSELPPVPKEYTTALKVNPKLAEALKLAADVT